MSDSVVVGVRPWLPWPLCRWRSWTEPFRAERLAALRIGLAVVVLLDVATSYLPQVHDFYGPDSISRFGDRDVYGYLARSPHYMWSLLRGFGDPLNLTLALVISLVTSFWVLALLWPRQRQSSPSTDSASPGWAVAAWLVSTVWALLGSWAHWQALPDFEGNLNLTSAGLFWLAATGFLILAWIGRPGRRPAPNGRGCLLLVGVAWLTATGFLLLGLWRYLQQTIDRDNPFNLSWLLNPADDDPYILYWMMVLYVGVTILLLLGWWTRLSAIAVWALGWSFANLNAATDSNGDVARGILLFYLVVSPCGAVWSVDHWRARRRGAAAGPVYVDPWPVRLLFLQMICLYFFNGLYKLCGDEWRSGNSLYYVLANMAMARVSYDQFPLPLELLRILSWAVMIWEISFPLLVAIPRVRTVALGFGVLFHLGIWASIELGAFALYMLCFYLPLVPWERWDDRRQP